MGVIKWNSVMTQQKDYLQRTDPSYYISFYMKYYLIIMWIVVIELEW